LIRQRHIRCASVFLLCNILFYQFCFEGHYLYLALITAC
jgi:hypothetical protein